MENNGFITILWILWIVAVVVQLVVAVKFFDMASDIKAMKEMMLLQWMILGYQRLIPGSSDGRCGCISPLR